MSTTEPKSTAKPSNEGELDDLEDRVGSTIDGRYCLKELVGSGGMGAVYRAEHVTIRRPVAVKLLHPGLAEVPELARRFEREAFAIGRIDHPNCVKVSDFGKLDDGSLYLVMEFLEGESLGDVLAREGCLTPASSLHVARHVLTGLAHAHRAGIVHRDIKPDNIVLVNRDGDPQFAKVLDFGIAKLVDEAVEEGAEKLTQAGVTFGTPTYISPEQAIGDVADERADLYSLTVVLYEALAGRPPFTASDRLEVLAMHAGRPAPTLAQHMGNRAFPEVEALVARGLAKQKSDRFGSAGEYIHAIDGVLAVLNPPAFRPPTQPGAWPEEFTPTPQMIAESHANAGSTVSGMHAVTGPGHATPMMHTSGVHLTTSYGQPVDPAARRMRIRLAIGAAVVAALVLVIALVASGSSNEESAQEDTPPEWMGTPDLEPTLGERAQEQLNRGSPDETIDLLKAQPEAIDGDANAQLQLAHAHAHKSEYEEALTAYRRALDLDGSLIADSALQANLGLMIDDDGKIYLEAAKLLIEFGKDNRGSTRLLELAAGKNAAARREAFELAESIGLGDQVDRVTSFSWDLQQGKTCQERKAAVAKLRALGDKEAIAALEKARYRRSGRRARKRRNANACLKTAADDAIKYLRSLPGPADK